MLAKIRGAFRSTEPRRVQAEMPEQMRTHTYKVTKEGLSPSARSLDEFYGIQDSQHQVQEIFRTMQYAEELRKEDNSPLDTDPRQGHVRLPEHGFESHPESGFRLHKGEVKVVGNQNFIQTTSVSDNWIAKNMVGTWDKTDATFSLSFQPLLHPELPASTQHQVEVRTFQAKQKSRAGDLIQSAQYWESRAQDFDGTDEDINDFPNQVVAPGLSIGADAVMSETYYTDGAPRKFPVFDLEHSSGNTVVAGNRVKGGRPFGARLTATRDSDSLSVVLERPEVGTTEKVEWVLSDGVLHYEKYKKG